jgi:hypothetical protein
MGLIAIRMGLDESQSHPSCYSSTCHPSQEVCLLQPIESRCVFRHTSCQKLHIEEDFPTRFDMAPAMAELVSSNLNHSIPPHLRWHSPCSSSLLSSLVFLPHRPRAVWSLFTGIGCSSWQNRLRRFSCLFSPRLEGRCLLT